MSSKGKKRNEISVSPNQRKKRGKEIEPEEKGGNTARLGKRGRLFPSRLSPKLSEGSFQAVSASCLVRKHGFR